MLQGRPGSVTQIPILTMPDDDITHPIPDLTGYITEGQIVLSRELHRQGVLPPIDVLPSLSRLMNAGIGEGRTVREHREWADQLYAIYAQGREARLMAAIVGESGLGEADRRALTFADRFEREFVNQGGTRRTIEETVERGWQLLESMPRDDLLRIRDATWDARQAGAAPRRGRAVSTARGGAPTRQNLLRSRRRLERVNKGVGLLRRKREALVAELFRIARPAADQRVSIADRAARAYPALLAALADQGAAGLRVIGWPSRELRVEIRAGVGVGHPDLGTPAAAADTAEPRRPRHAAGKHRHGTGQRGHRVRAADRAAARCGQPRDTAAAPRGGGVAYVTSGQYPRAPGRAGSRPAHHAHPARARRARARRAPAAESGPAPADLAWSPAAPPPPARRDPFLSAGPPPAAPAAAPPSSCTIAPSGSAMSSLRSPSYSTTLTAFARLRLRTSPGIGIR